MAKSKTKKNKATEGSHEFRALTHEEKKIGAQVYERVKKILRKNGTTNSNCKKAWATIYQAVSRYICIGVKSVLVLK